MNSKLHISLTCRNETFEITILSLSLCRNDLEPVQIRLKVSKGEQQLPSSFEGCGRQTCIFMRLLQSLKIRGELLSRPRGDRWRCFQSKKQQTNLMPSYRR